MKFYQLLFTGFALAQIASVAKADDRLLKDTTLLPSVTVTALRYPERINEVPLAVSKINVHDIQNSIGNGFDDVLDKIPGVLASVRSGTPDMKLTIRGFGARGAGDRSNSGTSRSIKVLIDGFPETEPDGRTSFDNIDMAFTDNIEVVRSNASSVFGNSAAGIVSISTFPTTQHDFLKVNLLGGAWGMKKLAISAYDDSFFGGISANFSGTQFDGYRQNSSGEKYTANIGIKSLLTGNTLLSTFLTGGMNEYYIPGPLSLSQFEETPEAANETYLKREEHRKNYTLRLGMRLEHYFDDNNKIEATAYANPKFLERSERGTFRNFTRYHIGGSASYKNEMQISEGLRNIAIAGIDEAYQDGAILFYNLTDNAKRGTLKENKSEGANTLGAYLQDELIIDKNISLLLGLRYDKVSYYSECYYSEGAESLPPYGVKHYEHLTPKVALSYMFNDFSMVYASLGGGIEVPAGNETSPSDEYPNLQINPLLDPIVSTTYELGTKHNLRFAGSILNSLSLDAALFYITVENELVPYSAGKFYMSAGETSRFGLEFALGADLLESLRFHASLTYMNGKYDEYLIDNGLLNAEDEGTFTNYSDNEIAGIPDMYYYVSLKYAPKWAYGFYGEVSAQGVNKYFADDANLYEVPSYNILNLSFGMDNYLKINSFTGIRFYVNLNNLTDEHYASSAYINPSLDKTTKQALYLESGLPRNVSVGFGLKFD